MTQIKFKKKYATEKEHFHTDVFFKDEYIGYYMSGNDVEGCEWVFESRGIFPLFCAGTQKEIKDILFKIANKETVNIKQHFGIVLKNFKL